MRVFLHPTYLNATAPCWPHAAMTSQNLINSRGSEKGNSGKELKEFRGPTESIPNSRQQIDTAHARVAS